MRNLTRCLSLLLATAMLSTNLAAAAPAAPVKFNAKLAAYISQRTSEFDQIPAERKAELKTISQFVERQLRAGQPAQLIFICTHNSRRSHLSQIWASDAAQYYGIADVKCFSGGTEATAFNPRAIAALDRAGVIIEKTDDAKNPRYKVQVAEGLEPLFCLSKKYSDEANPQSDFCAVMTCSEADKGCPTVAGAALRVALHYQDPKAADGTPLEAATYDERCAQICREMFYLFSQVKP
jgi:arsenate reductase (thioredoxin)